MVKTQENVAAGGAGEGEGSKRQMKDVAGARAQKAFEGRGKTI